MQHAEWWKAVKHSPTDYTSTKKHIWVCWTEQFECSSGILTEGDAGMRKDHAWKLLCDLLRCGRLSNWHQNLKAVNCDNDLWRVSIVWLGHGSFLIWCVELRFAPVWFSDALTSILIPWSAYFASSKLNRFWVWKWRNNPLLWCVELRFAAVWFSDALTSILIPWSHFPFFRLDRFWETWNLRNNPVLMFRESKTSLGKKRTLKTSVYTFVLSSVRLKPAPAPSGIAAEANRMSICWKCVCLDRWLPSYFSEDRS